MVTPALPARRAAATSVWPAASRAAVAAATALPLADVDVAPIPLNTEEEGVALLAGADLVARTIASPRQLPVGAIMALVGAPLFVMLLRGRAR